MAPRNRTTINAETEARRNLMDVGPCTPQEIYHMFHPPVSSRTLWRCSGKATVDSTNGNVHTLSSVRYQ